MALTMPTNPVLAARDMLATAVADNPMEAWLAEQERIRVLSIVERRLYYSGEQYDEENADAATAQNLSSVHLLPEHLKRHAYSTQIQEAVDFLAGQLTEEFQVTAKDATVEEKIKGALAASPDLSSGDEDDDDVSITNIVRDALVAGDVACHVRWDPIDETAWFEFWESEAVEFRYSQGNRHQLDEVRVNELVWLDTDGTMQEHVQTTVYTMRAGECVTWTEIDGQAPEYANPVPLGLPFIPWLPVRGHKKRLRATRGESIITGQAMAAADRYDAVENTSYVIARYNSHGNLVLIGDASQVQAQAGGVVRKDVADVLTFPAGTVAIPMSLPTDPQMIEHQRGVLLDSLYGCFGLVRLDTGTVQGMGNVSGYALEILNRKTDGTFSQISKQLLRDLRRMLNMGLNVDAYMSVAPLEPMPLLEPTPEAMLQVDLERIARMQAVDPDVEYRDRTMDIRLGSGYIVDEVMIREDFKANLISRQEALRQRGYDDEKIDKIEQEIKDAAPQQPEASLSAGAQAQVAAMLNGAQGAGSNGSTQAGSTLNSGQTTEPQPQEAQTP